VKTLANHIEYELQHGFWSHCAICEDPITALVAITIALSRLNPRVSKMKSPFSLWQCLQESFLIGAY